MLRSRVARFATSTVVAVGLALAGPAVSAVLAHSQLVTSDPAAGDVVATAPPEIRLVFSEPISPKATSLDLLGPDGTTVTAFAGSPDPADPYTLVAPLPKLADGIYTVDWRALSAADGHATMGTFTFGVGDVTPQPAAGTDSSGALHAGHDAATAFLETESRIVGDLGLLLAAGLPLIGWLVLRRTGSIGLTRATGAALLLAAIGAAGLLWLGASSAGISVFDYLGDRIGLLLLARTAITLVAGLVVLASARRSARVGLLIGGLAGAVGLVLLAASGHAAAYASPAPMVAMIVHLFAVAVWLAGLLAIAWMATLGPGPEAALVVVPRFSALALAAVGFIALTGIYADWIQTREVLSLDTPYTATLAIKVALALAAFAVGALNYLGVRRPPFRRRIILESALALAVLVATGVLASGSPPGQEQPVAIAPATSSAGATGPPASLALAPGRPGPTRFVATLPATLGNGETVELDLARLDVAGQARIPMRVIEGLPTQFAASGGLLPADSRWDAAVILRGADGIERSRTRFEFAMDATSVSEGRATPVLDPAVVIGLVLLLTAILAAAFAIAGGAPPRVERGLGRAALIAASATGALLGLVMLIGGPPL